MFINYNKRFITKPRLKLTTDDSLNQEGNMERICTLPETETKNVHKTIRYAFCGFRVLLTYRQLRSQNIYCYQVGQIHINTQ